MKARYGGTIGSTQGDRKLRTPAAAATRSAGPSEASQRSMPNMLRPLGVSGRDPSGSRAAASPAARVTLPWTAAGRGG